MKRNLFALAVLSGASLTVHAQSSVTMYGIVDAAVNYVSNTHAAKGKFNFVSGGYYGDRWGIKGTEDLGGGTAAIFNLENGFDIGSGNFAASGTEFNRQGFVGLANKQYGSLTFGRQYTPTTDLIESFGPDLGASGIATYPGDMSDFDNSVRVNNSVKYTSPTVNGFTGEAMYGFGNTAGSMNTGSTYAAGFKYATGPVLLGATYFHSMNATPDTTAWSGTANAIPNISLVNGFNTAQSMQYVNAAAAYVAGKLSLGMNYSYVQYRPTTTSAVFTHSVTFNSAGVSAAYYIAADLLAALTYTYTYGQSVDAASKAATPRVQQIGLRTLYMLSKRTALYAFAGFSHADGSTLNANATGLINATPALGDNANGAWSSSRSQAMFRVGMFNKF